MSPSDAIPLIAAAAVTLVAAFTDVTRFKVPNALTFPALVLGLVASTWLGGLSGLGTSLLGAVAGFAVLLAFHALGGVGAGDVKLFTALGAWLGPAFTLEVFLAAALAAGGYAVVLAVLQGGIGAAFLRVASLGGVLLSPGSWRVPKADVRAEVCRPDRRRRLVPFAAMTCLAFFATLAYRHHVEPFGSDPAPAESARTIR